MIDRVALLLLAAAGLAGCAGGPAPVPLRPAEDSEALGEPLFEPMLVVGMPDLRPPERPAAAAATAMSARNAPLGDVLLGLFKDSDIDLLIDESVQGVPCTFDIKNASVEAAFESLLRGLDLDYEWDGSFLRVRSVVRRTLYVDLLPDGGDTARSAAAVAEGGRRRDFWLEIERALPQMIGAQGRAVVNQTAGAIHVEASPAAVERLRELVQTTVRRSNAQVSIEARVLEVRLDDQHSLGVNWSLLPGLFQSSKTGLAPGGAVVAQTAPSGGTALNFGVLDTDDFSVFVDALARQGQVRVLSSPRVATMNHVPATLRVADQLPVISREVITDQGVARSEFSVSFVDAGIAIEVTPMVGEDGMVTVRVRPEVTQQTGTVVTPDGLIEQPVLSRRETSTVVRVADGQSIAIGGLRSTRKDETLQGVPFLMDLPLLGQLFSSTVQSREEVELMIVVVPRVLDADWIDEEVRRGAHRLVSLRRPFRWNSIGLESFRPEEWRRGAAQGPPSAAAAPGVRLDDPPGRVAASPDEGRTITRAGLADQVLRRAQNALERGEVRTALELLEQAAALSPRRAEALVAAGILLDRLGHRARAASFLDRALEVGPDDPLALTARGALELVHGSPHAARRWFERAHERAPAAWTAANLAAALLLCGEPATARALLTARLQVDPNAPPELFANLAAADLAVGEPAAAAGHLQRALAAGADPRNPRIHALRRLVDAAGAAER